MPCISCSIYSFSLFLDSAWWSPYQPDCWGFILYLNQGIMGSKYQFHCNQYLFYFKLVTPLNLIFSWNNIYLTRKCMIRLLHLTPVGEVTLVCCHKSGWFHRHEQFFFFFYWTYTPATIHISVVKSSNDAFTLSVKTCNTAWVIIQTLGQHWLKLILKCKEDIHVERTETFPV